MNETYTDANLAGVKKLVKAWGIEGAREFILKTLRVQRINGNARMIAVWESNVNALESLVK
jgi:hypothetical protein